MHARCYVELGIPVLPLHYPVTDARARRLGAVCSCRNPDCAAPAKHPLGSLVPHGLKQATLDSEQVRAWWAEHPRANIGLATGHRFDVLDIDGPTGAVAIRAFARTHQLSGSGPLVRTGSGGWHYYFAPTGLGNPAPRDLPHVDWRGLGGYVVAPPSRHATGTRYRFVRDLTHPIPTVPAALRDRLQPAPPQRPSPARPERPGLRNHPYGQRALADECAQLAAMAPNSGRNTFLFNAGLRLFGLVRGEVLDADQVHARLLAAARACGLSDREALATLRSARRLADRNPPRGVPIRPATSTRPRSRVRTPRTRQAPTGDCDGLPARTPARGQVAMTRKETGPGRAATGHHEQHEQATQETPRRRGNAPGPDTGRCPLMPASDDTAMAVQMEDGTWSAGCASHQRNLGRGMDETMAEAAVRAHNWLKHPPARERRDERDSRGR